MPDDHAVQLSRADVWPPTERLKEFVRTHLRETKNPETVPFQATDKPGKALKWEPVARFDVTPPQE